MIKKPFIFPSKYEELQGDPDGPNCVATNRGLEWEQLGDDETLETIEGRPTVTDVLFAVF